MQALYQYWLLRLTESKLYTDEEGKPDPAIKEAVCESVRDSSHYTIQKSFPTLSGCLLSLMKCFLCGQTQIPLSFKRNISPFTLSAPVYPFFLE